MTDDGALSSRAGDAARSRGQARACGAAEREAASCASNAGGDTVEGVPDISAVVSPLIDLLRPLVGQAVRAFFGTAVGMMCLGLVLG
ncbi:MAG TPA: hypothetical protein VGB85_06150, partial [Nannocystis sp.]